MRTIFFDGKYRRVNAQVIDAFAPGTFKAKGVFETMLVLDGVVMDIALHIKRLRAGLKQLGIRSPKLEPSVLKEVSKRNRLSYARVRLMVWQTGKKAHVMVMAMAYHVSPKKMYRVCLIKSDRMAHSRLADVKSLDYGLFSGAYAIARSKGFDEALLLNRKGHIFEASRANIFWIKDRVLYTPPLSSGCLNGITRQQVIKQAQKLKILVKEKGLTPEILKNADAAFLTNSLIGIKVIDMTSIRDKSIRD